LGVVQGPAHSDRMAHRRLFDVGGHDPYLTELAGDPGQGPDAGTKYTIVVTYKDSHLNLLQIVFHRAWRRHSRRGVRTRFVIIAPEIRSDGSDGPSEARLLPRCHR